MLLISCLRNYTEEEQIQYIENKLPQDD